MSYVEIYAVRPNGDVEFYDEVHHAGGGALLIWMRLGEDHGNPLPIMNDESWWKWAAQCCRDGTFAPHEAICYGISCDWGITSKAHLIEAAEALETFERRHSSPTLRGMANVMRHAAADPEVIGICYNHTSVVADPLWRPWDGEKDEPKVYNVNRDTGHWWIWKESK